MARPTAAEMLEYADKMWPTTRQHYDPSIVAEEGKLVQKHDLSITFPVSLFIQGFRHFLWDTHTERWQFVAFSVVQVLSVRTLSM